MLWSRWDNTGTEYLRLWSDNAGFRADSGIVGVIEESPLRVGYRIHCDPNWHTRELTVRVTGARGNSALDLLSDGAGNWRTRSGEPLPALTGCIDVDLMATPFTNTLPIRRLGLAVGASAEIQVVYVSFPTLELSAMRQRYTNMGVIDGTQHYKYENVSGEPFEALLTVDADGLVLDYPGLFRRYLLT
ncbi:MAG: putative glycolipid-binding domain-containing protein [Anaerolinea sp.]|nr:putative glycolipid-binding domain-containing protein [Anaerolinea sp.]